MGETCTYKCSLDDASLKKAELELNENPEERTVQLNRFKKWIISQEWLNAPMDDIFLLAFLRATKFDHLAARKLLDQAMTRMTKYPGWFRNLDPADPVVNKIWKEGCVVPLPGRDKDGCKVILLRSNPAISCDYTVDQWFMANYMIAEYLMMNEKNQVNGFVIFIDHRDRNLKTLKFVGLHNAQLWFQILQQRSPARIKAVHYFNADLMFNTILTMMEHYMTDKMWERFIDHGRSLETLYDYIDMCLLPTDYLPDDYTGPDAGDTESIIEKTVHDFNKPEVLNFLRKLHDEEYGVDLSSKPRGDKLEIALGVSQDA